MKRISLALVCLALLSLTVLAQSTDKQAADEVIAVTKAQWAAEMKKNTAEAMKNIADDYTEFNSDYATRLEGKALSMRLSEATAGGSGGVVAAEMANAKVQVYGDVAILS